ncbi:MAG: dethiobiotin synthase [Cytophagales bacterium]|nr:dethiobiotin synthase [Cytophagales bacterium]
MSKNYFVTAIGTDSGKTLASAILCQSQTAEYWKPVQTGKIHDAETIRSWTENKIRIHPNTYAFPLPVSPHIAAQKEKQEIHLRNIQIPKKRDPSCALFIEGAGGVYTPLNTKETMIDLMRHLKTQIILVSNLYLGAINHTLLTMHALKNDPVIGIILNGKEDKEVEETLLKRTQLPLILRIYPEKNINAQIIEQYSQQVNLPPPS